MSENKSVHFFFKMLLNLAPLFPQKNGLVAPKKMCGHQQHGFKSQVEFPRLDLHKRHSSTKPCSQPQPQQQQPQPQPQPWSCFTACGSFRIYIKQKKKSIRVVSSTLSAGKFSPNRWMIKNAFHSKPRKARGATATDSSTKHSQETEKQQFSTIPRGFCLRSG